MSGLLVRLGLAALAALGFAPSVGRLTDLPRDHARIVGLDDAGARRATSSVESGRGLRRAQSSRDAAIRRAQKAGSDSTRLGDLICLADGSSDESAASPKASAASAPARRYLARHATLSKKDYERLFSGPCGQRNSRDCYILAALGAIPLSHREALFRTSIKPDQQGCVVSFPFGVSKSRTSVHVTPNDLGPQRVMVNGLWKSIEPVNSTDGWKALEAAYILLLNGRDENGQVNRQAAAFGDPVDVLERMVKTKELAKIVINAHQNALAHDPQNADLAVDALNSFDPDRHMLTLGSLVNVPTRDYFIDGVHFYRGHAYVAPVVDQQNEKVMLLNPFDSTRPLVVSYSTVLRAFRVLRRLELDVDSTYK